MPSTTIRSPDEFECLRVGIDLRPLADPFLRGFGRYTHEIVRALGTRAGLRLIGFCDADLHHDVAIPVVRYGGRREIAREQWTLPRLLAREHIDVLLCPANRGLPYLAPCPTVLTLHDAVEWDRVNVDASRGRSRLRFVYASAASLAGSSLIITVSRHSAVEIAQRLNLPPSRLRVVHEAAGSQFHAEPGPRDDAIRARLGLPDRYLLYVGGFDRKKCVPDLLRACGHLDSDVDVGIVLAGRPDAESDRLAGLAGTLGLARRMHWVGYLPDDELAALYRGARCFVYPARAEGFGLPVVEAMSCGAPVVATTAGALSEVIGDGGVLVPPDEPAALAAAIARLLSDADHYTAQRAAALRRASAFSWDATASQTEMVLREAASISTPRMAMRRLMRAVPAMRAAMH